jgi:YfiH family protein
MTYFAPPILNKINGITAGITYSNREELNQTASIPGLNFGENTDVPMHLVKRNLSHLNELLGHTGDIALAEQVHGSEVKTVTKAGYYKGADGLITNRSDLLLGIKVADCAAILMSDSDAGVLAAVHAGWRGASSHILPNALNKMIGLGASPEQIRCYLSPCLSLKNFEIGEEVAEQFPSGFIDRAIGHKPHLDLKGYLKQQLIEAGINDTNIECDARCTIDDTSFYSHRRERDHAGRMLAFIKQTETNS